MLSSSLFLVFFLSLSLLVVDFVDAFTFTTTNGSSVRYKCNKQPHTLTTTLSSSSSSSPSPSLLYMSGEMGTGFGGSGSDGGGDDDTAALLLDEFVQMIPMVFSMVTILGIKTVKDVINYPPMAFDRYMLQKDPKQQTLPIVMLCKLIGVLLFKTLHDATYYPLLWTKQFIQNSNTTGKQQ